MTNVELVASDYTPLPPPGGQIPKSPAPVPGPRRVIRFDAETGRLPEEHTIIEEPSEAITLEPALHQLVEPVHEVSIEEHVPRRVVPDRIKEWGKFVLKQAGSAYALTWPRLSQAIRNQHTGLRNRDIAAGALGAVTLVYMGRRLLSTTSTKSLKA